MKIFLRGQSPLEYVIMFAALIGALVAVVVVFKPNLSRSYSSINGNISQLLQGG
jgi:hypothetical protein